MSNSFAEFLTRLHCQDDAAARELFARFSHQLIALAQRHISAGLRHKVDAEDVVQSAYKSFFCRYGSGNLDVVNWNSLWGLLTLITMRKCAERAAYHGAERRDFTREVSLPPGDGAASWLDPLGREPTPEEASHDFLWRAHRAAPAAGEVVVFNRSYHEGVLVERVHKLVPESVWSTRYALIDAFEQGLAARGTLVLKFFLHISKQEQLKRFKDRLDDPTKQWKISESDYADRQHWDEYMTAYEEALSRCSTVQAPWYVIPADHK